MKEYFKNKKEEEALKNIITSSTETNTEKTVDYFHNMAVTITSVIDEIEIHFGLVESKESALYSLEELNADLRITMVKVRDQLIAYENTHPLFHDNLKDWNTISREIEDYVFKLEYKGKLNNSELKDWKIKKDTLVLKLKMFEESIKNNTEEIDDKDEIEPN